MNSRNGLSESDGDSRLARAIAEYQADLRSDSNANRETVLSKYADIADELEACLDGLEMLHRIVAPANASGSRLDDDSLAQPVNELNLPDLRILGEIGRGGMGIVYEAEQISLKRRVAVKILPYSSLLSDHQRARFQNEARAAAMLEHPNIVSIYYIGNSGGVDYFAMQLVDGCNLTQVTDAIRENGKLSAEEKLLTNNQFIKELRNNYRNGRSDNECHYFHRIVEKVIQAAKAIHYAHSEGITHRDIKPSNLLLDKKGKLFVADFGLARIESGAAMTMTGDVMGTLRYMSPEQATGNQNIVDHRADVYSLGVTLYELLTHQLPFDGRNRGELQRQIENGKPISLRKIDHAIPADLEKVVLKSIAREPNLRYATAIAFADDLQSFLDGRPIAARPPGLAKNLWMNAKRNPKLAATLTSTLVLAMAAIVFMFQFFKATTRANMLLLQEKQTIYANDMDAAHAAIDAKRPNQAQKLLVKYIPDKGVPDRRGFEWYCLWQMTESELGAFAGHESAIEAIAVSPDGSLIATGGNSDNTLRVWETSSGTPRCTFREIPKMIGSIAFLNDNKTMVVSGDCLRLYDVLQKKLIGTYPSPDQGEAVSRFAVSPDETMLVSGANSSSIKVWAIDKSGPTPALRFLRRGPSSEITERTWIVAIAISPDRRFVAWSNRVSHDLFIWDLQSNAIIRRGDSHHGHERPISSLDFSSDGKLLGTGSWDGTVKIWDTSNWNCLRTLEQHSDIVRDVKFLPGSKSLVSGGYAGRLLRWDIEAGVAAEFLNDPHLDFRRICVSETGEFFVTSTAERLANQPAGISVSGSFANGGETQIQLWNCADLTRICPMIPIHQRSYLEYRIERAHVSSLSLSNDSSRVAIGCRDGTLRIENLPDFSDAQKMSSGQLTPTEPVVHLPHCIQSVCFSNSCDAITATAETDFVRLKLETKRQPILTTREKNVFRSSGSAGAQGSFMATRYGGLGFYSSDLSFVHELIPDFDKHPFQLGFAVDSTGYAVACQDGSIFSWNLEHNKAIQLCRIRGPTDVNSIAVSKNGEFVATGHRDGLVRVYDSREGKLVRLLQRHVQPVTALAFSGEPLRLASGGSDTSVHIWEVQSGRSLLHLNNHEGGISCLSFAEDGRRLTVGVNVAYSEEVGIVRIWQANDAVVAEAKIK